MSRKQYFDYFPSPGRQGTLHRHGPVQGVEAAVHLGAEAL